MVKAREVNKDIKAIAAKVKTAVFSYDDIHNPDVKNEFHYDYEKVISEVARVNGWNKDEARKYLLNNHILSPLPNGEYKVEVGTSTKGGGGLNYHGTAFFTLANDDYQVKYHELAHSLQKAYHLFDDEKIDKLYRTSAKGIDEEKTEELQINKLEYTQYLNEMHSESFSYAAMMLRAENPLDFAKQVYKAYNDARLSNMSGFFSFGKTEYGGDNNNSKFYATFPVIKETIKTVLKIRKQGKTKDFFDENGVLKDEKLAKLCEQAVIKSAYSPRTLNAYFKYRIFDGHNSDEHGWRRDAIKSVASTLHSCVIRLAFEGNLVNKINHIINHNKMEKEEKKKIDQIAGEYKVFKDDETQALYDYINFNARCSQIAAKYEGGDFLNAVTLYAQSVSFLRYKHKTINEAGNRVQASFLGEKFSRKKKDTLSDDMMRLKYFVRDRKDNPYFCHLVQEDVDLATVVKMYQEKLKNPEHKQITDPTPIKLSAEKENPRFAMNIIRENMCHIRDFVSDYKCSKSFEQALVNLSFKGVNTINNPQIREKLADAVHFKWDIFGQKKRKFNRELMETLDILGDNVFDQLNNLSYEAYKKQFEGKDVTIDEILEKTKADIQEYNKNNKKESAVKEDNTLQKTDTQQNEDRAKAVHMVYNNLEAMNYLADRYGISDKLRLQMQKMATLPEDKLASKQLRNSLCDVVSFNGDWLGKEKRQFKHDLNKLMDSFVEDAKYQKDNPSYKKVCSEAMVQLNMSKTVNLSVETNEKPEIQQNVAKEIPINEHVEEEKTPKDKVIDKLRSWGIEDNTYMLLTKNEDIYTTFGTGDIRDIKGYFEEGEAEIKRTGKDVVYGTNNSVIGAYFKEGVYVVSQSDKLRDELYHKGRDVGLSAMLSNGESFVYFNKMKNSVLNNKWKDVKDECEKDNIQYIKDYQQRQQRLKEMEERATAQNICGVLENVVNIADKHDKTGLLKKALIHTYICDEERMLKLDFWGKLAQKYTTQSPHGQEVTLKDFGKLGLDISKDIKLNQSKEAYREVKKNCAEAKSAEDMIKVAKRCAKVTQKAPLDNTYSAVASR